MHIFSKLAAFAAVICLSLGFGGVAANARDHHNCGPGRAHCQTFSGHVSRSHIHPRHHWHRGGPRIGFEFRIGNARHWDPYYPRYRPHYIYRPVPIIRKGRFCSNDAAIHKARALGVRHIRAYSYHDHVVIKGRKHGHHVHLAFARARGCPIIRY
jgi:hypothetical protein